MPGNWRREKIQGSEIKEEEKKRKDSRIKEEEKKRFKDQRRAFARIEAIEELTIGNLAAMICAFQYIVYGHPLIN